jgi:hypothetical protein
LRLGAGVLLLAIAGNILAGNVPTSARLPRWLGEAYPFVAATGLGCYGLVVRDKTAVTFALAILGGWFAKTGWQGYRLIRNMFAGLDQIVLSLILFAVAVAVSLGKSGRLTHWLAQWGWVAPPLTDTDGTPTIANVSEPAP